MRALFAGAFCACLMLNANVPSDAQSSHVASVAQRYAVALQSFNSNLSGATAKDMANHVLWLASYYSLDPRLLIAIVGVESSWHPHAQSPSGAQGLGQLMPATAGALSVEALDRYENLDGTARFLRRLLNRYWRLGHDARYSLAIAGYNAGPEAVRRFGGVPPYAETQAYVQRVLGLWHRLQGSLPGAGAQIAASATASHLSAKRKGRPPATGSVADFTRIESATYGRVAAPAAESPQDFPEAIALRESRTLEAEAVMPAPKKSFGRWLSRAFGVH